MRTLKFSLYLCLLFAVCSCAKDIEVLSGSIYGKITDSKSGELIPGVTLTLTPGGISKTTGNDGTYEFLELQPQQYTIQAQKSKYKSSNITVEVVAGLVASGDMRLEPEVEEAVIEFSSTSLNFGATQTELPLTIKNKGNIETEWSLELGNNNWLSANPTAGRIASQKSQTIVFSVNRDKLAESKSAVVSISANGNSYPITVSCVPRGQEEAEMSVSPKSVSFGSESSVENITISNVGEADLSWSIGTISAACLTVSQNSGIVAPNGSKVVQLKLDRDIMPETLNTTIVVSDGVKEQSIVVTATKKEVRTEFAVSPSVVDFGSASSVENITISNVGEADLSWSIGTISAACLTVSQNSGIVAPNGSKVVQLKLDRNIMPETLNTTIVVSDGVKEQPIVVTATKEEVRAELAVSPSALDFGKTSSVENITISNNGNGDLRWNIAGVTASCLSFSQTSGVVAPNGSKVVQVVLDRETMPEDLSTTFIVSDGVKEQPIVVTATKEEVRAELAVSPSALDFGKSSSVENITISNNGNGDLRWNIAGVTASCLSFSQTSGVVAPYGSKVVQVVLDRETMPEELSTNFIVSDGVKELLVNVNAVKENSSSGGGGSTNEDYSSATVDVFSINHLEAEILSCKRSGTTVTLTYLLTNTYNKDMSISLFRNKSSISDDQYNTYTSYKFTVGSASSNNVDPLYDAKLYSNQPTKSTITIQNVDSSAKKISCIINASYAWPGSAVYTNNFKLLNVPIY